MVEENAEDDFTLQLLNSYLSSGNIMNDQI